MPAIVRVKRRVDEEPLSAFVLNGKRRRVQDDAVAIGEPINLNETVASCEDAVPKDEVSTILKFAGTLEEQDDTATTHFVRQSKDALRELAQKMARKPNGATERARNEVRQTSLENRFRVVNCLRTTLAHEDALPKDLTILDIERHNDNSVKDVSKIGVKAVATAAVAACVDSSILHHNNALIELKPNTQQSTDSDTGYVYDVYVPEDEHQVAHMDLTNDNYLSVRPFDDLVYEDCFNDDDDDDSEDSNRENYEGNDYPDDDEYDDADDGDLEPDDVHQIRNAVAQFVFDDEDEDLEETATGELISSSDEDCNPFEDPYVHSVDAVDDFANDDVDRYGIAYARYKARILKRLNGGDTDADLDGSEEISDLEDGSGEEDFHSASENESMTN